MMYEFLFSWLTLSHSCIIPLHVRHSVASFRVIQRLIIQWNTKKKQKVEARHSAQGKGQVRLNEAAGGGGGASLPLLQPKKSLHWSTPSIISVLKSGEWGSEEEKQQKHKKQNLMSPRFHNLLQHFKFFLFLWRSTLFSNYYYNQGALCHTWEVFDECVHHISRRGPWLDEIKNPRIYLSVFLCGLSLYYDVSTWDKDPRPVTLLEDGLV